MGAVVVSVLGALGAPLRQPFAHGAAGLELIRVMARHRRLITAMAWREVSDPLAGSFLGLAWALFHPLIMMAVYVLVFSTIFQVRVPGAEGTGSFALYMLSGYLPWMVLAQVLVSSCGSVADRPELAKQVVFPLEVLPLKGVVAALVPQLVGTAFLAGYQWFVQGALPCTWLAIPALLACEAAVLAGVAFAMAASSVYFRDLKQLASVAVMVGFYLTPILYSLEMAPAWLGDILRWNPVSYFIAPFRDACFYGELRTPWAWVALGLSTLVFPVAGYRMFRKLKPYFASVL